MCIHKLFFKKNQGVTILSDMVYRQWSLEGKRIETRVCADPIPAMNIGLGWRKMLPLHLQWKPLEHIFFRSLIYRIKKTLVQISFDV